jgi:iron complex outermembrane receptor protein
MCPKTLLRCRQKGFSVLSRWLASNARIVRGWRPHQSRLCVALLIGSGLGLSVGLAHAAESAPVYETVVVADTTAPTSAREDHAASATAVVIADRTPRAAESVTQILSEQAGAVVTRLGGLGSTATLSLRGSTANQVSVYVDGAPLNTVTGGGVDLGAIPVGDVERIEIYRGMSPIAFGASAIGGVVSISTAVPTESRAVFDVGGGSFGTYYGGARGAWSQGRLHVYGGVHAMASNGDFPYTDPGTTNLTTADDKNARRRNNDLQQVDGMVRAVADFPEGRRVSAGLLFFGRAQGLPGEASLAHPVARLGTTRATAILGYESRQALGPGGRAKATVYGNYDLSHFDDPNRDINSISTDAHDRTYTLGGTTTWRHVACPWLILSGLFDARFDRFSPSDTDVSGSPGTRLFGATGLESDFWIERIRTDVIPSIRIEMAREKTSGRNDFYKFLSTSEPVHHVLPIARLALIKEVTGWLSLRANGGRYARLPSLIELYGNTGLLLGNPTLKPERGINADVGTVVAWKNGSSRVSWSTSAFVSFIDDLIQYQYGSGHARPRNLGSARILGVESEATLEFGRHFRATIAGTLSDPRNTSVIESQHDRQLPFRPRYRAYVRPEWRAVRLTSQTSFGFYVDGDATGSNYLVPANSTAAPARVLFGAGVYAELTAGFSIRCTAQNLANSPVYDISNYPLPGRELYVSVAWSHPANKKGDSP